MEGDEISDAFLVHAIPAFVKRFEVRHRRRAVVFGRVLVEERGEGVAIGGAGVGEVENVLAIPDDALAEILGLDLALAVIVARVRAAVRVVRVEAGVVRVRVRRLDGAAFVRRDAHGKRKHCREEERGEGILAVFGEHDLSGFEVERRGNRTGSLLIILFIMQKVKYLEKPKNANI